MYHDFPSHKNIRNVIYCYVTLSTNHELYIIVNLHHKENHNVTLNITLFFVR